MKTLISLKSANLPDGRTGSFLGPYPAPRNPMGDTATEIVGNLIGDTEVVSLFARDQIHIATTSLLVPGHRAEMLEKRPAARGVEGVKEAAWSQITPSLHQLDAGGGRNWDGTRHSAYAESISPGRRHPRCLTNLEQQFAVSVRPSHALGEIQLI